MFRRSGRRFADQNMRQSKNRERVPVPSERALVAPRHSRPIIRIEQLEAGPALVLAGAVLAGRRIGLALAGLAQEMRLDCDVALGRGLAALLLEEDAADRRLAGGGRRVDAGPP